MLYQLYICAADDAAPVTRLDRLRALKEKQAARKQALEGVVAHADANWHDDAKANITRHSQEIGSTLQEAAEVAEVLEASDELSKAKLAEVAQIVRGLSDSMIHQLTQFKDLVEGDAQAQVEEMIVKVRADAQAAQTRIDALK